MTSLRNILVTGGAGYVGAVLVPKLLKAGFRVRVLDLFLYGDEVLDSVRKDEHLEVVHGDLRDIALVRRATNGCDAVIHLACISNDPSFELDPELGKSINYDAFTPLVEASREAGVSRFIFASTSSVYGVKQEHDVTELLSREPLTDYSKYKALCEDILREYQSPSFTTVIVRPATVCGYSPRMRLDLTVNLLTNHAVNCGTIRVFGGSQFRPNIHIDDITDLYIHLLQLPDHSVAGRIWNAGYENLSVAAIAERVQGIVGTENVRIETQSTEDLRSYRISSEQIRRDIGFSPRWTIRDAVSDVVNAFGNGSLPNPLEDVKYFNVKMMQTVGLK